MNPNLYFILSVLWAMVCKKEGHLFQLNSIVEWQQSLIHDHPLRAMHENMQISDAKALIQYINTRKESKESVIQLHSTEAYQAISILYPDSWQNFWNEKNETTCGYQL